MTDDFVPVFREGEDCSLEGLDAVERGVPQRAAGQDTEPDLDYESGLSSTVGLLFF